MNHGLVTAGLLMLATVAGGCASSLSGSTCSRDQLRREQSVRILSDGRTARVTH